MAGVARQAQTSQESYHDKAREHPDDGKHPDGGLYNKGPSYSSYSGYIMMPNMNNDPYMSNGSLSPPIPRTEATQMPHLEGSQTSGCACCCCSHPTCLAHSSPLK
uniref:Lymphoid enhancer binding factor 1 n=1 Tax=Rousettus aegyptiacus TaxID=9407 RepID=A0A7J8E880_ROUAE|nr:lymphoid enhancer binding factor 1 [Rousettus aegyptiacus]